MSQHATTDEIRRLIQLGHKDRARVLLDAALASDPDHPEHLYLRGMLHAGEGTNRAALADFDAALRLMPDLPPVLFNRGLVLFRMERTGEALDDFLAVVRSQPGNADAWTNIGILHSREGRAEDAIESLRKSELLSPGSPFVLRALANALRDAGQHHESIRLHRKVMAATPADPAALTDYALSLLSAGDLAEAHSHYQRALALDPGDQTALAGLYMTGNELGEQALVSSLMDYDALLGHGALQTHDGIDLDALRDAILAHEHLVWEPAGRSTHAGKQSPMLEQSQGSRFDRFHRMIERQVEARIRAIADDPRLRGHPWVAAMPRRWHLQSWITILEQGGQQTPHIHPAGWLSGVFYVDAGKPSVVDAGNLVFGRTQEDLPLARAAREHEHHPSRGQLVMFPSYFFHNTVPYAGDGPRISLAFDVVPERD